MIVVAGVGPGNPKYLTVEVLEKIKKIEVVLAFGRISNTFKEIRDDIIEISKVNDVINIINKNKEKETLLLASGDPNFYGIVNYLKTNGIIIDEVLPGLSSFQYMMSKLQLSWQNAKLISLHGREGELKSVKEEKISVILTDEENTPSVISKELRRMGVEGKLFVGYNLSYKDELIKETRVGYELEDISTLAIVVVVNEMD